MDDTIIVTVGVLTYNSASTVIETLESIKAQTYKNVELIVSDDCSKDDTVAICKHWIKENDSRFIRTEIITVERNTGLPSNGNRIGQASKGQWVKLIAGDDLLEHDCIEKLVKYVDATPEANVVFSRITHFTFHSDGIINRGAITPSIDVVRTFNNKDAKGQLISLLNDDSILPAPSVFYKTIFFKEHPYLEKYKNEEDYPLWITLTNGGFRLNIIEDPLVLYRIGSSISRPKDYYFSPLYFQSRNQFFWDYCYDIYKNNKDEHWKDIERGYNKYRKFLLYCELVEALTHNKKTKWHSLVVRTINKFIRKYVSYTL